MPADPRNQPMTGDHLEERDGKFHREGVEVDPPADPHPVQEEREWPETVLFRDGEGNLCVVDEAEAGTLPPQNVHRYVPAQKLEEVEAKLADARYTGDNHHNAAACPHCNPELEAQIKAHREAIARVDKAEKELAAEREGRRRSNECDVAVVAEVAAQRDKAEADLAQVRERLEGMAPNLHGIPYVEYLRRSDVLAALTTPSTEEQRCGGNGFGEQRYGTGQKTAPVPCGCPDCSAPTGTEETLTMIALAIKNVSLPGLDLHGVGPERGVELLIEYAHKLSRTPPCPDCFTPEPEGDDWPEEAWAWKRRVGGDVGFFPSPPTSAQTSVFDSRRYVPAAPSMDDWPPEKLVNALARCAFERERPRSEAEDSAHQPVHKYAQLPHATTQRRRDEALEDLEALKPFLSAPSIPVGERELRAALLSDEVIDKVAEERCIEALYGHWNDGRDFPGREENQRRRYAQLAKKPGVQESWKAGARREAERLLAAVDALSSLPLEQGSGEARTEYRVIGDRHGFNVTPDVPLGLRIQSRTVTETEWTDLPASPPLGHGEEAR